MVCTDWMTHKNEVVNKAILWEYDVDSPSWDWQKMKRIVVQRVIEYGRLQDWYAMFQMYGGHNNVRSIILEIPYLTPKSMAFVCVLFDIKKDDLKCYKREQSRKRLLSC